MLKLCQERERRGWTQAQLAVYADVSPTTVCQIENRKLKPTSQTMKALAGALGIPTHLAPALLDDVPDPPDPAASSAA